METQQEQSRQQQQKEDGGSGKGSLVCRQSSTRWSPTSDQIRILKELYYNNGVRSPSAEQIQRISASLRQYGKIEGKNVFYWFQNHKARERQKKRFTSTSDMPMQKCIGNINGGDWKPDHQDYYYSTHNHPNITPGVSCASPSSGVLGVGYGSVTMEKSFRDCSISAGGGSKCVGGSINQSLGWVSADQPYVSFNSLRRGKTAIDERLGEVKKEKEEGPEIETLPLFPINSEDINGFCNIKPNSDSYYYTGNWYHQAHNDKASSRTSLELSLNSYTAISPDSI